MNNIYYIFIFNILKKGILYCAAFSLISFSRIYLDHYYWFLRIFFLLIFGVRACLESLPLFLYMFLNMFSFWFYSIYVIFSTILNYMMKLKQLTGFAHSLHFTPAIHLSQKKMKINAPSIIFLSFFCVFICFAFILSYLFNIILKWCYYWLFSRLREFCTSFHNSTLLSHRGHHKIAYHEC